MVQGAGAPGAGALSMLLPDRSMRRLFTPLIAAFLAFAPPALAQTTTANKGLTLPVVGSSVNIWGGILNNDLQNIDSALGGSALIAITGNTTLLPSPLLQNTNYTFTGTISSLAAITFPAYSGSIIVKNATTGGYAITVGVAGSGTQVTIPNGQTVVMWSDGANFNSPFVAGMTVGAVAASGSGTEYTFQDHSNLVFYAGNSAGTVLPSAAINGGFASNTAGSECGDIDFPIYISGAPSIIAMNGCVGGHPSFTPSAGSTWNLGGIGQSWWNEYVQAIYDEGGNVIAQPSNYSDGFFQNYSLMAGQITGSVGTGAAFYDSLGNLMAEMDASPSGASVNHVELFSQVTGAFPSVQAKCGDAHCALQIIGQGDLGVIILPPMGGSGGLRVGAALAEEGSGAINAGTGLWVANNQAVAGQGQFVGVFGAIAATAGNVGELIAVNCPNTGGNTVSFTNGSANIASANTPPVGCPVTLTDAGGSLPTNFATATNYYVVSSVPATSFQVAVLPGGTAIVAGSAGSGVPSAGYSAIETSAGVTVLAGINLTNGDWDCNAAKYWIPATGTTSTVQKAAITTSSNTMPVEPHTSMVDLEVAFPASLPQNILMGPTRFLLATPTEVYLLSQPTFAVSTATGDGELRCRRTH